MGGGSRSVVRVSAAETFRQNPTSNVETANSELAVREDLSSFPDAKGMLGIEERGLVLPPKS